MNKQNKISPAQLQQGTYFADFDAVLLQNLIDHAELLQLKPHDFIFKYNEPYKKKIFILYQGELITQRKTGETTDNQPGAIIGLSNYLDGSNYHSSVMANTVSTVLALDDQTFRQLESQYTALSSLLDRIIADRIRQRSTSQHDISGPLGQPVRNTMKSPLSTCSNTLSLREAYKIMDERKIGSLGVIDENDKLFGVLTFAGLAEAFAEKNADPDDSLMQAACENPVTVTQYTPLWQASEKLSQFNIKYLIVTDGHNPVGIISQTDILKTFINEQGDFLQQIAHATSFTQLKQFYDQLPDYAQQLHQQNRQASLAVYLLSKAHLAIQQQATRLTLYEHEQIHGPAPTDYALLIMGSGGRHEMLLNPDQDNGIIIDDRNGDLTEDQRSWFKIFTEQLNINLDDCGYILCPGDIMARNPLFQKTLTEWKTQISHLTNKPNLKAARWSNIVFDFTTLYGDDSLTRDLYQHLIVQIKDHPELLGYMVEDDAEGEPAIGLFNRLITSPDKNHKGAIDLKRNGLRIIADAVRIYAIAYGIEEQNTLERLKGLVHGGHLSAELAESIIYAHEEILDLLLLHQIEQAHQHQQTDKLIYPEQLSDQVRSVLRVSMRAIKRLQDQLQGEFGRSAF